MDIKNETNKKTNSTKINSNIKKLSCAKKNEHLKALIKLKQEEHIIEKTINNHLENVKIDSKILKDLQINYLNFANERQKMHNSLQHSVNEIKESWNDIKNVINDLNKFGNLDVDGYKTKLYKLWEKIQEYYKNECIDSLKEEETSLDQSLMEFNSTLSRYENCDFTNTLISTKNRHRKNSENLQDFEEIENFGSLIAKTGHTQNWNNEDHLLFLKLRKKHKTIPSLVYAIQKKCPDLTTKNIVNHEAWYKFYIKLRDQQKSAIKDWRQQKHSQRVIPIEENEFHILDQKKAKKKSVKENCRSKPQHYVNDNNHKSKELIKKWKEEKENDRLMQEEQTKQEKQSKQILENRRKIRAQRLKIAVAEYKERKISDKIVSGESKPEKIIKSHNLIMAFRDQDNYYIEKRKRILSSNRENNSHEFKNEKKSVSTKIRVSTLFKCTKVWKEKCKNRIKNGQTQESLYIKDLPKMSTGRQNNESL